MELLEGRLAEGVMRGEKKTRSWEKLDDYKDGLLIYYAKREYHIKNINCCKCNGKTTKEHEEKEIQNTMVMERTRKSACTRTAQRTSNTGQLKV